MRKKQLSKNVASKIFLSLIFLMFLFSFIPVTTAQTDNPCEIGEVYLEGAGCIAPGVKMDYKVYPADNKKISSSLGEVQTIRINNPYAAAGQPVIVEFTLENVGDQLGYPFDKISLPADTFALQLAVDKDMQVVMADGRRIDVWGLMSGHQKVLFLLGISNGQFWETVKKTLSGRSCGYVEITNYLPKSVNSKLQDLNNGKAAKVYSWQCLKIVDMPYFKTSIKSYCQDDIDSACITRLNKELGNAVGDVVTVLLSSGTKSNLVKGECERPNSGTFWKSVGGYLKGNVNMIQCAIGENGLKPGQRVTFKFVVIVPADTPVLNPQALADLDEIKTTDGELYGGYTESASCIDSTNPIACHTVYGAIYPVAQENLITWFGNRANQVLSLVKCSGKEVWFLGKHSFKGCMAYGHSEIDVVGSPVWEGQGIFFVLGPALSASITMILWGAYIAGSLTPFVRRRT